MEADCEPIERKKISVSAGTRELAAALPPPSFPLIILEPSLDPTMPARVAQPVPFQNSPRTLGKNSWFDRKRRRGDVAKHRLEEKHFDPSSDDLELGSNRCPEGQRGSIETRSATIRIRIRTGLVSIRKRRRRGWRRGQVRECRVEEGVR